VKPEDAYEDFIVKPPVRKVKRGKLFPAPLTNKYSLLEWLLITINIEELHRDRI